MWTVGRGSCTAGFRTTGASCMWQKLGWRQMPRHFLIGYFWVLHSILPPPVPTCSPCDPLQRTPPIPTVSLREDSQLTAPTPPSLPDGTSTPSRQGPITKPLCISLRGKRQVVAYGQITQNKKVHGKSLTKDQVSVMVVDFGPDWGWAPLPYTTDGADVVSQTKDSFVIWDRCDVDILEKILEVRETPLTRHEATKKSIYANNVIKEIVIPSDIIGGDWTDHCSADDVTDMFMTKSWLAVLWMNIAIFELYLLCQEHGHRHISFVSASFTNDQVGIAQEKYYIRNRLKAPGDVLSCPISKDAHWLLMVLFKSTSNAYVFDSSHLTWSNTVPPKMREFFKLSYERYCGNTKELNWKPKEVCGGLYTQPPSYERSTNRKIRERNAGGESRANS